MSVLTSGSSSQGIQQRTQMAELDKRLQALLAEEEIRDIDCHFGQFIVSLCRWSDSLSESELTDLRLLYLLAVKLSAELAQGHVCVPLEAMHDWFTGLGISVPEQWHEGLLKYSVVACGEGTAPIVYEFESFYLERFWRFEKAIADFTRHSLRQLPTDTATQQSQVTENLNRLFGPLSERKVHSKADCEIDWQRVAACLALKQQFLLISGGPGTGKTTTVIKLLALVIEQLFGAADALPVIKMAAPTGKAAARLSESIRAAKSVLDASDSVKKFIPDEAQTLHRLLGYQAKSTEYRHNRKNPLLIDVLVVDEASMIDVSMMAKLLDSLPRFTRLILLGDKDQLSSVEAGSVFADLNSFAGNSPTIKQQFDLLLDDAPAVDPQDAAHNVFWHYSKRQTDWLLANGAVHKKALANFPHVEQVGVDCRANLFKSYRFAEHSGIKQLADASNRGDAASFLQLLQRGGEDFSWHDRESRGIFSSDADSVQPLIDEAVLAYTEYLQLLQQLLQQQAPAEQVIKKFERYRVLCAANHGHCGVEGINQRVEAALVAAGLISIDSQFYIGRPIIIETNNYDLKLFNGDIGVCLSDPESGRYVAFLGADGEVRRFLPARIPQHRTVFAMTVHKSQGSEFDHTALVLPDSYTPLLSRELLYTAITRAKQRFSLFGSASLVQRMVATHTQRWSGLAKRLQVSIDRRNL